jgi:hypothetical protein
MGKGVCETDAVVRVFLEKSGYEVLGLLGYVAPQLGREIQFLRCDASIDRLVVDPIKRWQPAKHYIQNNTDAPDIAARVVPHRKDLRGHVVRCAFLFSHHLPRIHQLRRSKIDDLYL